MFCHSPASEQDTCFTRASLARAYAFISSSSFTFFSKAALPSGSRAIVSVCADGGQGTVAVLERV